MSVLPPTDRQQAMRDHDTPRAVLAAFVEYLTFGRRPRLLFRVLVLQLIVIVGELQVFRAVHPAVIRTFDGLTVVELYLGVTTVALVVLVAFVHRMSQLVFVPAFRDPRHVARAVASYLLLGAAVVALMVPVPNVPPSVTDGVSPPEVALGAMVTSNLAALVAIGFYALFDLEDYPSRSRIETTIAAWLRSLDWVDAPEGSQTKEARYAEFRERTEELSALLDYAVTRDGKRLQADFEAWLEGFGTHGLLSQEAIVTGGAENERLADQHEALQDIVDRLERIQQ